MLSAIQIVKIIRDRIEKRMKNETKKKRIQLKREWALHN